VGGQVDQLSEK